jgi:hypothetical protein
VNGCQKLKHRGSKGGSVWQMMADKWNDKNFAPATASQPDWHPHYTSLETITHEMVLDYLPLNAEKVKEQFESMMTVFKRTIPKWELSGQSNGGHHADDDDDDYNLLKNRYDTDNIPPDGGLSSSSESESSK